MSPLDLLLVLTVGVIALTPLADRIRVPQPVLLTIFGLALALLPFTPQLTINPSVVLPVVLPPLLFAATQRTTVHEFREHVGAVLLLAVGLTVATFVVSALVAHAVGLPWPVAFVLGAIVSPPDPVASTAVARRLRLPQRLVTILEGEGMFNDATALVAYQVTVAAAVTGSISAGHVMTDLVLAVVAGVGVGLALGWVAKLVLAAIDDAYAETTLTILVPFVAYLAAEKAHASGVLAVLMLGLFLRTYGHSATTSRGWLLGRSVWSYVDFLVTSLLFAALGFELLKVITDRSVDAGTWWLAAAVIATVAVFRAVWVFPAAWLARARARRHDYPLPIGWQESTLVSWAGMRGVVTVATALAVPATVAGGGSFPHRGAVVVAALSCVMVTLVAQGLTLAPLAGRLKVAGDDDSGRELSRLRRRAAQAALDHVRDATAADDVADRVRRAAILQYEGFLSAQAAMEQARGLCDDDVEEATEQLGDVLASASAVERDVVLTARRRGQVSATSADEVLRDIEGRVLRDLG